MTRGTWVIVDLKDGSHFAGIVTALAPGSVTVSGNGGRRTIATSDIKSYLPLTRK